MVIPAKTASKIVALRPAIEALIVRTCMHPEILAEKSENDVILTDLIQQLSTSTDWLPTGEEGIN